MKITKATVADAKHLADYIRTVLTVAIVQKRAGQQK